MVGLVVVSHSGELARAVAALAAGLGGDAVRVEPAGGGADGALGVHAAAIGAAVRRADSGDGVVILGDLGSSIISARTALETEDDGRARLADAPLVEGAIAAAVMASAGCSLAEVLRAAEGTRGARKF